jgi:uncharacterized protein YndB with AHSA1/START domain
MTTSTDRIEKHFEFNAPRARVWSALSDATEFGTWFGVALDGAFSTGATVRGKLTNPKYQHVTLEMRITALEPEHYFAYRWHPAAIDTAVDYSDEPMTLVEFRLADTAGGTQVTITETGFDALPANRRVEAFRMNEGGWTSQGRKLGVYVEQ